MEIDPIKLARGLNRARKAAGLTQAALAEKAKKSPATISSLESGKVARPQLRTILDLAEVLNVEPSELTGAVAEPTQSKAERKLAEILDAVYENLALLERHMEDPPDEATADEAMHRFYDLLPQPLEHLSRLEKEAIGEHIEGVTKAFRAQIDMDRRIAEWNLAQYGHLHKRHALA